MRAGVRAIWVVVTAVVLGMGVAAHADPLVTKTKDGKLHGKAINEGKVRAWLGVPYAAAPVGDLRWKAPQPVAKWSGERDATKYGAHCAQNHVFDDMVFQDDGPSEDCLYLNVYAPATADGKAKLPVMFWIHGGGYSGGGGNEPRHNGDFLPLKGVVLVTINYRLGVFGFLATPELGKEANGSAGNYAFMDMIAALRWVKDNVGEFGGDPANVTIFGESAGSFAVSTLMASPMAKGLFAKAIGESGGAVVSNSMSVDTLADREQKDQQWVSGLGVSSLKELRALPTQAILDGAKKPGARFQPDVDGEVLTEPVGASYAAGRQAHIPVLAGWNADEQPGLAKDMTAEKWKEFARKNFGEHAEEFLRVFPGETDEQAQRSAVDFGSDQFIAYGTWAWLEAQRKTGDAPEWRYHFELQATPSKYHKGTWAFHSDDIEYVFGTLDTRPGWDVRPEDRKLSDEMMTYWTNFAKTGAPNGTGLPKWPSYKDEGYPLIHLKTEITAGPDKLRERYLFLQQGMPPRTP